MQRVLQEQIRGLKEIWATIWRDLTICTQTDLKDWLNISFTYDKTDDLLEQQATDCIITPEHYLPEVVDGTLMWTPFSFLYFDWKQIFQKWLSSPCVSLLISK